LSGKYKIKVLLVIAKISKSAYYKYIRYGCIELNEFERDKDILFMISEIQTKNNYCIGVFRMSKLILKEYGVICNHKKAYRIMKTYNILSVIKRRTAQGNFFRKNIKSNILANNFVSTIPFNKLVTDITEIRRYGKKLYLSTIKDLCTNMIVSYDIKPNVSTVNILSMFNRIKNKALPTGSILHSDQGSAFNSHDYQKALEENNFIQSMSRAGTPLDNAPMESFFSSFKSEVIHNKHIKISSFEDLELKTKEYINYYNYERIQKKLGYLTPYEYQEKIMKKVPV